MAVLLMVAASVSQAAQTPSLLMVRGSDVYLYAGQSVSSDRIVRLERGETLEPLAEAVGVATWYLVRTQTGLSGWVRRIDVAPRRESRDFFITRNSATWSVRTNDGQNFEGTWAAEPGEVSNQAAGTWSLQDATGKTLSRGRWLLEKFSTGWNGTWSATVEGRKVELSGTWTADFPQESYTQFSEFFAAAARQVIRGIWNSKSASGSWSLGGKQ